MKKRKILLTAAASLFSVLLICCSDITSSAALSALNHSVRKVIPALFPYMVLSSFFVHLRLADSVSRVLPMCYFGFPDSAAPVLLTGLLFGFPAGASGCAHLFRSGELSREESARLCALSGHVSPAFLMGSIGALWDSKAYGLFLFLCSTAYTVITGFILGRKHTVPSSSVITPAKEENTVTVFCQSVTSAASACLGIIGFIVFFRSAGAVIAETLPALRAFVSVVFEFSYGCVYSAGLGGIRGAALTGFAVGFSGLSVLLQTASFISPEGISLLPFAVSKLCEGIFLASASAVFYFFCPLESAADAFSSLPVGVSGISIAVPVVLCAVHIAGKFLFSNNKCPRLR